MATAEQSVSAAGDPAFAAAHLGCDVGEPLLRIDRLYFDPEDAPVELAVSYFDPGHYSYRVRLRRRSPLGACPGPNSSRPRTPVSHRCQSSGLQPRWVARTW